MHENTILKTIPPPLITVGLTCYNAENTIERALRSALAQNWSNLEVVLVDDFSTDDSWEIVSRIAKTDKRLKVFRHSSNRGVAATRNSILERSSGSFLAFFDDDDESLPSRVATQYFAILNYESICNLKEIACYASGVRDYPNGYRLEICALGSRPLIPKGEDLIDYLLFNRRKKGIFYGAGTPSCGLMARVSTFEFIGGFDASLRRVEDVDFAIRLALSGGHFVGCNEPLYIQTATVSADKTPKVNLDAELALVEKHREYLMKKKRYFYALDWFKIRYYHFSGQTLRFLMALFLFLIKYPFDGFRHLILSAPSRIMHEKNINKIF